MAEVVSLIASITALGGLLKAVGAGLEKYRHLKEARERINALNNELSDFCGLLAHIELACSQSDSGITVEVATTMANITSKAKSKALELNSVLQIQSLTACEESQYSKIHRLKWFKEKRRIERVFGEIRNARLSLGTYMILSNM